MSKEIPEDQHIFERVARLLHQQKEMFGNFELPTPSKLTKNDLQSYPTSNSLHNESDSTQEESSEQFIQDGNQELDPINRCTTLDELKLLCENSESLRTDLPNTNLVFGVGNPSADLMIIGEAPGETEDRLQEPFVGKAGELLDKIMGAINLDRSQIYIANILKHRPPQNRDPKPEERERSLPFLLRQIELIDPKIILCVGKVSGTTLLNKDLTLKEMRQKVHSFHQRELMVTYHPAALLRNPQWKRPTWEDVQKLRTRYDELLAN